MGTTQLGGREGLSSSRHGGLAMGCFGVTWVVPNLGHCEQPAWSEFKSRESALRHCKICALCLGVNCAEGRSRFKHLRLRIDWV